METLESTLLLKSRSFSFYSHRVRLPSGRTTTRNVVKHPGAAAILAEGPGGLVFVEQYRYAPGVRLLEIPAGTLEWGEDPLDCAKRELMEETGYRAAQWEKLLECYVAPGYSDELIHIYRARGLTPGCPRPEDDEDLKVVELPLEEALRMARDNEIRDGKTLIALLYAYSASK